MNVRVRKGLSALAVLALLLSVSTSEADEQQPTAVRKAIDEGNARYIEACGKLDANAFAANYDRHGASLRPGGEVVLGRDAIAKATREEWQKLTGPLIVTIKTQELWVVADIAYETGLYTLGVTSAGAVSKQISGRYVTLWKKQADGGWKIFRDMSVSQDERRPAS